MAHLAYLNPYRSFFNVKGKDFFDLMQRISSNDTIRFKNNELVQTILLNDKARIIDILSIKKISDDEAYVLCADFNKTYTWLDRFIFSEKIQFTQFKSFIYTILEDEFILTTGSPQGFIFKDFNGLTTLITTNAVPDLLKYVTDLEYTKFRVDRLLSEFSHEISDDFIPTELGLVEHISFDKGCYIGQEIIARLDTYKKISKFLCQIVFKEEVVFPNQTNLIKLDGTIQGKVTSSSINSTETIALAVLHKSVAEIGQKLEIVYKEKNYLATVTKVNSEKTYHIF